MAGDSQLGQQRAALPAARAGNEGTGHFLASGRLGGTRARWHDDFGSGAQEIRRLHHDLGGQLSALEGITTVLLILALGGLGGMRLVGSGGGIERAVRLGYDKIRMPIGIAEVLAAGGVLLAAVSTDLEWLGSVAAVGVILMMIGAAGYHIRARDKFAILPSIVVAVLAVLYLVAINS